MADRQIDRLKTLMDVFLEASTLRAESLDLRPEAVDLTEVVRAEVERISADPRLGNVEIRVTSRGRTRGCWDRGRIGQALRNLLSNAVIYGRERPIEVMVSGTAHSVSVSVSDQGIGISRADQGRIFEPFERAVPGTHFNGMGLGLYVARQIAIAHQGELTVRSRVGEGARFTLKLPLGRAGVVARAG
jgi:signal transduction histidine kinase